MQKLKSFSICALILAIALAGCTSSATVPTKTEKFEFKSVGQETGFSCDLTYPSDWILSDKYESGLLFYKYGNNENYNSIPVRTPLLQTTLYISDVSGKDLNDKYKSQLDYEKKILHEIVSTDTGENWIDFQKTMKVTYTPYFGTEKDEKIGDFQGTVISDSKYAGAIHTSYHFMHKENFVGYFDFSAKIQNEKDFESASMGFFSAIASTKCDK